MPGKTRRQAIASYCEELQRSEVQSSACRGRHHQLSDPKKASTRTNPMEIEPTTTTMRSIIQRIATGPKLSKNLTLEEARTGMRLILEGKVEPVQAGIFLIALRMKRETDDENKGILEALRDVTRTVAAPVDTLVDIADPYDGFRRSLPVSPLLPAVLAACGVSVVSHGVEAVGPKFGVTHRQVLRAAGIPVDLSPEEAARRVGNPDQRSFCPKLHDLIELRDLIVKRPALTTVEVMLKPVWGRRTTHLVTGYVHKAYPRIYATLARHAGFSSVLLVRGVEGSVIPPLCHTGRFFSSDDHDVDEKSALELQPAELGIHRDVRAVPIPNHVKTPERVPQDDWGGDSQSIARTAAQIGQLALEGETGPARDALIYTAAVCLQHLGHQPSVAKAAEDVRAVLDSGEALARFQAAL